MAEAPLKSLPEGSILPGPRNNSIKSLPEGSILPGPRTQPEDEDKRNVVGDVVLGAVYGPLSMVQGLNELGAAAFDKTFGTETTDDVTEFYDWALDAIKPETGAGKVASVATEIGASLVPFIGWASRASQVARATKMGIDASKVVAPAKSIFGKSAEAYGKSKAGQALLANTSKSLGGRTARSVGVGVPMAGYTAGVEFMFSPDGRSTLSESVGFLPDALHTEVHRGDLEDDNAGRILRNKFRRGVEGGALSVAFDSAIMGLTQGARIAGGITPVHKTAKFISERAASLGGAVAASRVGQSAPVQNAKEFATKWFTPDGGADPFLTKTIRDIKDREDLMQRRALDIMDELHSASDNVLKKGSFWEKTKPQAEEFKPRLNAYLRGGHSFPRKVFPNDPNSDEIIDATIFAKKYGKEVRDAADKMVALKSEYEDHMMKMLEDARSSAPDGSDTQKWAKEAISIIKLADESSESYMRQLYEAHENPLKFLRNLDFSNATTKKLYNEATDQVFKHLRNTDEYSPKSGKTDVEVYDKARGVVNESIHLPAASIPGANMNKVLSLAIKEFKKANTMEGTGGLIAQSTPKVSLDESVLIERKEILQKTPALKELMGEIQDPLESFTRTMSDMSKTLSAQKFYNTLSKDKGLTKLLTPKTLQQIVNGEKPSIVLVPKIEAILAASKKSAQGQGVNKKNLTQEQYVKQFAASAEAADNAGDITTKVFDNFEASRVANLTPEDYLREAEAGPQQNTTFTLDQYNRDLDKLGKGGLGYRQLSDEDAKELSMAGGPKNILGGTYGDLSGAFVSEEAYRALKTPLNISPFNGVASVFQQLRAFSQKMAIVPSPATQIRNIIGGISMLFMNGNLQRNLDMVETFSLFTRSLDQLDDAGLKRQAQILNATGLRDSSVIYKSLKEYQAFGRQINAGEKVGKVLDGIEDLVPFMQKFEKLYANSDAFFKAVAFRGEYNKLANAFTMGGFDIDAKINPLILDEMRKGGLLTRSSGLTTGLTDLELFAAELVKDTMPMYDRVAPAMRILDRFPVLGNFTSFASENVRNSYNILERGMKELSFEIGPDAREELIKNRVARGEAPEAVEAALKQFEVGIRSNGSQRLTNAIAGATIYPKMITQYSRKMTNTTDEENQGLQDSVQEYATGGDFLILSNDKKGNIEYVDLNYHNPYGYLVAAGTSALRTYDKQGRLGKDEASQIANTAMDFLSKIADPFASETLIFERLRNSLPKEMLVGRGGMTDTGAKIWRDSDSLGDKMVKGMAHIVEGVTPRYFLEIAEEKGGRVRPGKVYRSLTGMPDASGIKDYDPIEEGARLITGLTTMELNLNNTFNFAASEYASIRSDAKGAFTGMLDDADRTADDMVDAASQYIQTAIRLQTEMFGKYQAAIKTGADPRKIRQSMTKDANLSVDEATAIMRGELYIKGVAQDMFRDIQERQRRKEVEPMAEIPVFRIQELVRENLYRKLGSDEGYGAFQDIPSPTSVLPAGSILPPPRIAPAPAPAPVLPTGSILPPPRTPAPTGKVSPILLGGDPATKALAEQLGR